MVQVTVSKRLTFWNRANKLSEKDVSEALDRLNEEAIYAEVYRELEDGQLRDGLYAKAIVIAEGDTEMARVEYLKLRVQSIKDEMVLKGVVEQQAMEEEASRQKLEAKTKKERKAREKEFQRMALESFKKLRG